MTENPDVVESVLILKYVRDLGPNTREFSIVPSTGEKVKTRNSGVIAGEEEYGRAP
jgi:hypothetical protein